MGKFHIIEKLYAIFILVFFVTIYFQTEKAAVITLFSIGFAMTIYLLIYDLDNDQEMHSAARYRVKGLWYIVVAFCTFALTFVEDFSELQLVLIFIAIIEAVDNYKSYFVRRKRIKESRKT